LFDYASRNPADVSSLISAFDYAFAFDYVFAFDYALSL
jgi:hypothetical protein